jgi:4-carboxymuconolactone decarboxylase
VALIPPEFDSLPEEHMKLFQALIGMLLVIGTSVAAGHALSGRSEQAAVPPTGMSSQVPVGAYPKDVYADTGNRLPAIKRDAMDDAGKKLFDLRGPVDSFGPGGIRLYSPPVAEYMGEVNDFLRHKSGLDPRLVELAILVTARESDSEYVWTAHEPQGLKAGLQPEIIDIVRYRKSPDGLAEKDAVVILLGREVMGKHRVSSDVAVRAMNLFGKQGLVNIASLMGDYASTAILLNMFDQHVRPADKPLLPIP